MATYLDPKNPMVGIPAAHFIRRERCRGCDVAIIALSTIACVAATYFYVTKEDTLDTWPKIGLIAGAALSAGTLMYGIARMCRHCCCARQEILFTHTPYSSI